MVIYFMQIVQLINAVPPVDGEVSNTNSKKRPSGFEKWQPRKSLIHSKDSTRQGSRKSVQGDVEEKEDYSIPHVK